MLVRQDHDHGIWRFVLQIIQRLDTILGNTVEKQKVGVIMKTLYLECAMGAAGDMLMAALLELIPDRQAFIDQMNGLGLPGVRVAAEPSVKCGITGMHMRVTVDGEEEESEDVHEHHHEHDHEHHDHDHHHEHHHEHEHPHHHASVSGIEASGNDNFETI